MFMGSVGTLDFVPEHTDLAGMRVLLTGLHGSLGVEIARAFAEQQARLVLHAEDESPETLAMAEIVAQTAPDVRLFTGAFADHDQAVRFARAAVQALDGIDAVINLTRCAEPPRGASETDVERVVTEALTLPCLVTKIAANRMRTTLTEGAIVNVVTESRDASPAARIVSGVARAALSSMTRTEAKAAAQAGIRINAIAPAQGDRSRARCITGDPDLASLALHLVSRRGSRLSGLMFEAYAG